MSTRTNSPRLQQAKLKVWWLEAPRVSEREAAGCAADDALWMFDPAREELLLGLGCARDFSAAGARGLAALARAFRALEVDACGAVRHGGALLLGGGPFDPARAGGGVWGSAPAARWVVPQITFITRAGASYCAVAGAQTGQQAEALRDAALAALQTASGTPSSTTNAALTSASDDANIRASDDTDGALTDASIAASDDTDAAALADVRDAAGVQDLHESPAAFQRRVRDAAQAVARGELQKVVLARALQLQGARAFSPQDVLARLAETEPDALRYSLPLPAGRLIGATPERLLRVAGHAVFTDALAGSIARGAHTKADAAAARALLESKKDQEEHALVRSELLRALRPQLASLEAPDAPQILSTGALHHLHTPLRGTRASSATATQTTTQHKKNAQHSTDGSAYEHSQHQEPARAAAQHSTADSAREHSQHRGSARAAAQHFTDDGALELAARLHPTPAVAGLACDAALAWLRAREPLARGAYAGPFGWADRAGEGALAIALRCALLAGARATVFAGAGIVAASDPASEFLETELKMRALCDALRDA